MIIIHGNKNQGKTTRIKEVISFLKENNKTIGGFYSEKILNNQQVIGYDIVMISTNRSFPFLRINRVDTQQKIGPFYIDDFALTEGIIQIRKTILNKVDFLIIDEVGKLELNNKGWTVALENAITTFKGKIILAVRTSFVDEIINKWQLKDPLRIISVNDDFLELKHFLIE